VLAVSLFVSLFFCIELFLPGRHLYRWDTLFYNWPLWVDARAQVLSGRWPFWSDAICAGTPLLENINAGVLYPLRWLCGWLPLSPGYGLFLWLHFWLSLAGARLFLRAGFRLPAAAAWVGALAYAFGGYARSTWDTHNFVALPWIPWGLYFLLRSGARPAGGKWTAGMAISWGLMILGGDLQAALIWPVVAASALLLCAHPRRAAGALALALVAGLWLTAMQWLPAALAARESYRAGGLPFSEATVRSFHPLRLLELAVPYLFGNRDQWLGWLFGGEGERRPLPWTTSFHFGLLALSCIALAARRWRQPGVRWALTLVAVAVLLSLGRFLPGYAWWMKLPGVGAFRFPEKYLLWAALGCSVLAGLGASAWLALLRAPRARSARRSVWMTFVAAVGVTCAAAGWVLWRTSVFPMEDTWRWFGLRGLTVGLILAVTSWFFLGRRGRRAAGWIPFLVGAELMLHGWVEQPTTRAVHPLAVPAAAAAVRAQPDRSGRFLKDPALQHVPLPDTYETLRPSARQAVYYKEALAFNSPRLWGMRTADGFSPAEPAAMRALRISHLGRPEQPRSDPSALLSFVRATAVRWLLTSSERSRQLEALGLRSRPVSGWGASGECVLIEVLDNPEVELAASGDVPPEVRLVWRPRPGFLRIDLKPGGSADVWVKETLKKGWRAEDGEGNPLEIVPWREALMGVRLPAGVSQVRLSYSPPGWAVGAWVTAAGVAAALLVGAWRVGSSGRARFAQSPWAMAGVAGVLFLGVGLAARSHWSGTFDEGFHLTRGLALRSAGDSRLSYFHPPLQNLAGGYFAALAFEDRLELPRAPGWEQANVFRCATEWAAANRDIYIELTRAARWGALLFGVMLCGMGAYWAFRAAGPGAGWLAGLGLALSPTLLAHGNLNTTDVSVTVWVVAGTFALWLAVRTGGRAGLLSAALLFVLAAASKFTGLIWLAAFTFVCLPCLAIGQRRAWPLVYIPVALGLLAGLLLLLYGPLPQVVRVEGGRLAGLALPAGRYMEGLLLQSQHALEGQRTWFLGRASLHGAWWHLPAAAALKTSPAWVLAIGLAVLAALRRRWGWAFWIPWLPAVAFTVLLLAGNQLSIGVRHVLPLLALGIIGASTWIVRIPLPRLRQIAMALLVLSTLWTAAAAYPHYLSYFPAWACGVRNGHQWMVDSNYDWGQDLDELERRWAVLVRINGGAPPRLAYFGFIDPSLIYRLPVGDPSLCGFMDRVRHQGWGEDAYRDWRRRMEESRDPVVASISAVQLDPYGIDFSALRKQEPAARIGRCFGLYIPAP
jgi:hypothetical protein